MNENDARALAEQLLAAIKADEQDKADLLLQDLLIGAATNLARIADALTKRD